VIDSLIADRLWEERTKCYRVAFSYVKNEQDAMDIVSESYLKALKNIKQLKNDEYSSTWLIRIVINTALDHLRKSKKFVAASLEEELITNETSSHEESLELSHALEKLPTDYKTVVILRFFEDMKLTEISEVLEIPLSTVKHRLYAGLEKLNISMNLFIEEVQ